MINPTTTLGEKPSKDNAASFFRADSSLDDDHLHNYIGDDFFVEIVAPVVPPSLLGDGSEFDQEKEFLTLTRKDYMSLNRKLNMLVQHGEYFSSSTFTKMIFGHEAIVKQLLYKNAKLIRKMRS
ncbi:unnamed protein product [Lactuca virosa]|uniref:Uncharacterized protein n=1 Tax=Lactuca virosa TaxID=75947 RepID=A0AAU9LID7_9ASTR|nr:unnamed protein product [Lactuca virosa]